MPANGSKRATDRVCQAGPVALALDLDGVLWLGEDPIPGAADAVARLRSAGHPLVFCTNNSSRRLADVEAKLERHGIPPEGGVVTSALAAATLVEPGERVLICAGAGASEAVEQRGAVPVRDGSADAVLVGLHLDFDYERLRAAAVAVLGGARLLATNDDATYPTPDGPIPGGGAILAAVETATGVRARLGDDGIMVGDRPETDGRFAVALGYRFALVLTGVSTTAAGMDPTPDLVAPDLPTLVDQLLAEP
jgi:4-nitrophenyl phosphatase